MATVLKLGIVDLVALKASTLIVYDSRTEASPIWCRSSPTPMVSYHTRAKPRLTSGMRQSEMTRSDQVSSHRQEWIDLSTHCKVSVAASKGYGSVLQLV